MGLKTPLSQRNEKSSMYGEDKNFFRTSTNKKSVVKNHIVGSLYTPNMEFFPEDFPDLAFMVNIETRPKSSFLSDSIVSGTSNKRFDTVLGGLVNQFLGNPRKYQSLGMGFRMDVNYSGENKIFYGLNLALLFNDLKEDIPLGLQGNQTSTFLLLIGPSIGKRYSKYNIQLDFNYALFTIGEEIENGESNIVQLNGWSPGIVFNYPLRLGKAIPHQFYEKTFPMQNYLNLCFGVRYLKYSLNEVSGPMVQLGIGWRISLRGD